MLRYFYIAPYRFCWSLQAIVRLSIRFRRGNDFKVFVKVSEDKTEGRKFILQRGRAGINTEML